MRGEVTDINTAQNSQTHAISSEILGGLGPLPTPPPVGGVPLPHTPLLASTKPLRPQNSRQIYAYATITQAG